MSKSTNGLDTPLREKGIYIKSGKKYPAEREFQLLRLDLSVLLVELGLSRMYAVKGNNFRSLKYFMITYIVQSLFCGGFLPSAYP